MSPTPQLKPSRLPSRLWRVLTDSARKLRDWAAEALRRTGRGLLQMPHRAAELTVGRIVVFAVKAALLVMVAFVAVYWFVSRRASTVPSELPVDRVAYLTSQGWGASRESADRQTFYYTPQGTSIKRLRYSWLVALERPWSTERLASPENMRHYRFVVDTAPTPANPDQLPVGFARRFDPAIGDSVLDLSCAACHTGELHVTANTGERVSIRVDGGQAMHAFTSEAPGEFLPDLGNSLLQTYLNPFKFRRFSKKVLGARYPHGIFKLHSDLGTVLWDVMAQALSEKWHGLYPYEEGFGRTDALTRINNNVFGYHIDSRNLYVGDGPTSYPPVFNIWKFSWVQYSAEARQPMARNFGETLGVGADYKLVTDSGGALPPQDRFATSTNVPGIVALEEVLTHLKPPKWPEDILPQINCARAQRGKELFNQLCFHCHGPDTEHPLEKQFKWWMAPLKTDAEPHWDIPVIPLAAIGTDPNSAVNFANRRYDISKTGVTDEDMRRVLLPRWAVDEERRIEFFQAKAAYMSQQKDLDCWGTAELAGIKADLADSGASLSGPSPCMDALKKIDAITPPSKQPACQGGPLVGLNGLACSEAVRAYEGAVLTVARSAAQVCPHISRALDSIDVTNTSSGAALNYIGSIMADKYYHDNGILDDAQQHLNGFGIEDIPQVVLGYKPRPLAGVWATPPFLHNGSVPTLYDLLSPVARRPRTFVTGQRAFDPVKVGLVTETQTVKSAVFDTSVTGNSNSGHEFRMGYVDPCKFGTAERAAGQYGVIGPELSEADKFALIEYLKIRRDDPDEPEFPDHCQAAVPGRTQ